MFKDMILFVLKECKDYWIKLALIWLDYLNYEDDIIKSELKEIMNNKKYSQDVRHMSKRLLYTGKLK